MVAALLIPPAGAAAVEEDLCLRVDPGIGSLADLDTVTLGFERGWIEILEVVPCDGGVGAGSVTAGDWDIGDLEQDPLTDEATAIAMLEAESGANRFGTPIGLLIRCSNGSTELFIAWQDYLGSDSPRVQSRIGDAKPSDMRWNLSTSSDSTFYPKDAVAFVKSMFGESQFVAQTQPYSEGNVTAVFNITGIEEAVVNVREACGW
jgi:type VI secretion system protein VasI